jgi:peptidoglycan/LPS O-acetylase OafA/YrhL
MAGNIMYLYRHKIAYNAFLFFLALATSIFSIVVAQNVAIFRPLYYVSAFALPYCSAYIGLTKLAPLPYFHRGDYSYGVYIYGFPIQQAIAFYFPHLRNWLFSFALAFPLSVAFATMSWHLIEKPALGVRKRFLPKAATLALDDEIERFTVRKLIFLMLIVAYGLFVMNAARVFPLHELYDKILHHPYKAGETQQPV